MEAISGPVSCPLPFTRISSAAAGAKVKLDCAYDPHWRRTQKIVSTWNGSAYVTQSTNKFVYDGWNLKGSVPSIYTRPNSG